jgi:hypothetical protein
MRPRKARYKQNVPRIQVVPILNNKVKWDKFENIWFPFPFFFTNKINQKFGLIGVSSN